MFSRFDTIPACDGQPPRDVAVASARYAYLRRAVTSKNYCCTDASFSPQMYTKSFFGPGTAVELTAFPRPPSWALREREGTGRVGGERREGKRRGGKRVGA